MKGRARPAQARWIAPLELRDQLEWLHPESYGWALACCSGDSALAEDVLQIVYVKILQGKARYGGKAAFKTWLFAVIRNTARDEQRRGVVRALLPARLGKHQARTQGETVDRTGNQVVVRRALSRVSARQREVLHLVFYHDLTIQEAAGVMGVSVGAARVHYERGKKRLREILVQEENPRWTSRKSSVS